MEDAGKQETPHMPHRRQQDPAHAQSSVAPTPPAGPPSRAPLGRDDGTGGGSAASSAAARDDDWSQALRRLERKRRSLDRAPPASNGSRLPPDYYPRATWITFRLEGIDVG